MKKTTNKMLILFIIFGILLSLFRIDYRFKTTVECCSDDYDYFIHASTIAFDFDLDYTNQNPRLFSYQKNGKNTPIGFIGSGIFAAPFLFLGEKISSLTNEDTSSEVFNYLLLMYSVSPIFYLFLSYLLLFKTISLFKLKVSKYILLLYLSSSGITYFAFERFSMTHAYEVFSISLIIYLSTKYYVSESKNLILSLAIPFSFLFSFLTRMSNYYIFLIPLIIRKLLINKKLSINRKMLFDKEIVFSALFSFMSFYLISNILYGELVFNPQKVYGTNINFSNYISSYQNYFEMFFSLVKTFLIVIFSFEFGLFWVCPILFGALICLIKNKENLKKVEIYLILICFSQNFFIIHIWQSTGSSYGFRYLFSLVPLAILVFFIYLNNNSLLNTYMKIFSILGLLSVLFYETTELTQLSISDQVNSFGKKIRYVEPDYVQGLFQSFIQLNSYLIIFTTSFIGVIFFKILLTFFSINSLNELLGSFGLPIENSDFQNYIFNLSEIGFSKIAIITLFLIYISYFIVYKMPENTSDKYSKKLN